MKLLSVFCLLALASAAAACTGTCKKNSAVHHFKFGNAKGMVLSDGPVVFKSNYFSVADVAVNRSYAALYRPTAPIIWQSNIVLVDTEAGRLLVDTGAFGSEVSSFADGGQLMANFEAAGVKPSSIDAILLTHGHSDHVAGMVDAEGKAAFPNAKVYVSKIEHDYWTATPFNNTSPTAPDEIQAIFVKEYTRSISAYEGKVNFVADGEMPLPGVKFELAPGHTPGHAAIVIESAGKKLYVIGDIWFSQPDQVRHPEWVHPLEINGEEGYESRTALMHKLSESGDLVAAFHEEFPGLGRITRMPTGFFDWVPEINRMLAKGNEC